MIPKAISGDEHNQDFSVTLFAQTNIQFLDLDLNISEDDLQDLSYHYLRLEIESYKTRQSIPSLHILKKDESANWIDLVKKESIDFEAHRNNRVHVDLEESLRIYKDQWFPLPIFRVSGTDSFIKAPIFWARGILVELPQEKDDNHLYRLVIALDTSVSTDSGDHERLDPKDIDNGNYSYQLCNDYRILEQFLLNEKINEWLQGIHKEYLLKEDPDLSVDAINKDLNKQLHLAHYLNIINLLLNKKYIIIPKIIVNPANENRSKIPVQLILDIGNSRTCGVMVEDHNLKNRYRLKIRNLSNITQVYDQAFPSSIEFATTSFTDLPVTSADLSKVFNWASLVRVGFEAQSLACAKSGNEGNTGLSSPKRYLWDLEQTNIEWKLNRSFSNFKNYNEEDNPHNYPTLSPIGDYIDDYGVALFGKVLDPDPIEGRIRSYNPKYSRSSMMTILIIEILAQAITQINSYSQRKLMKNTDQYRFIESIILTVPPAMPKQEIKIFRECVYQAIGILWKALRWDLNDPDQNIIKTFIEQKEPEDLDQVFPIFPKVSVDWDEAMCGQICYLYNEIVQNYNGNIDQFFNATSKKFFPPKDQKQISLATIDIGGGTTDLVINNYTCLEDCSFVPKQIFKESFKVAGDDILLQLIQDYILPAIVDYAKELGAKENEVKTILKQKLGGSTTDNIRDQSLKQQFTVQILQPIAIDYLSLYENYNPLNASPLSTVDVENYSFGKLIREHENNLGITISQELFDFIELEINKLTNKHFAIKDIPLKIDLKSLNEKFASCRGLDICEKVFSYITEVINSYVCDIVIITGRPSRLPGILTCFKNNLNIAGDRIIAFNQYHFDDWYPYQNPDGFVNDPKTSAAVGAVLCNLVSSGKLENFYLKVKTLEIRSCIKYLGKLDNSCEHLPRKDVFYKEPLDLDQPNYKIPAEQIIIPPGISNIGYRQLELERWPAYPLYKITISNKLGEAINSSTSATLSIVLERTENQDDEQSSSSKKYSDDGIRIKKVSLSDHNILNQYDISELEEEVELKLCTMPNTSLGGDVYWLDSGKVMKNV